MEDQVGAYDGPGKKGESGLKGDDRCDAQSIILVRDEKSVDNESGHQDPIGPFIDRFLFFNDIDNESGGGQKDEKQGKYEE